MEIIHFIGDGLAVAAAVLAYLASTAAVRSDEKRRADRERTDRLYRKTNQRLDSHIRSPLHKG